MNDANNIIKQNCILNIFNDTNSPRAVDLFTSLKIYAQAGLKQVLITNNDNIKIRSELNKKIL